MFVRKSMENTQWLMHCGGLNKYICKYIGTIDEKARVTLKSCFHKAQILLSKATFLHNIKISSSKKNEDMAKQNERDNHHPQARLTHFTEMIWYICGYGEVFTDLVDKVIPTQPLEHRADLETFRNKSNIEDGANLVSGSHSIRKNNGPSKMEATYRFRIINTTRVFEYIHKCW